MTHVRDSRSANCANMTHIVVLARYGSRCRQDGYKICPALACEVLSFQLENAGDGLPRMKTTKQEEKKMYWRNDIDWDPFWAIRRRSESEFLPALNAWGNDEQFIITAELPGVDPEDVEITVEGDTVSLRGERKSEAPVDELTCYRAERNSGKFARKLRLPYEVSNEGVTANYSNGVLTITLPRADVTKPRKIEIQATTSA